MNRKIIWKKVKNTHSESRDESDFINKIDEINKKIRETNEIKFWVGNTSFPIMPSDAYIIDHTLGVSILSIVDTYSFRIAIGKAFKIRDVAQDIEINLGCKHKFGWQEEHVLAMRALRLTLEKKKVPWFIFVLPNGKFEYVQEQDPVKFKTLYDKYKEAESIIGSSYMMSSGV